MTANPQHESKSSSRRALLAGALGGIAAWAASTFGRPSLVRASDGDTVIVGGEYTSSTVTRLTNTRNNNYVLWGESTTDGTGVRGLSVGSQGVLGSSTSGTGVIGTSTSYIGVSGETAATDRPGTFGRSGGNSTGVQGVSGSTLPAAKDKTGVFGYAAQDSNARGVWGETTSGVGVFGMATASSGGTPTGVHGQSNSTDGQGVFGVVTAVSGECYGGWGTAASTSGHAVHGNASAGSGVTYDVYGSTASPSGIGVYGVTFGGGSASRGVLGQTTSGHAIHGTATSGFAGYFAGKVYISKFQEMTEISTPLAPGANKARLFLLDNGSGKTQLCVRFNTAAIEVVATQP